MSVTSKTDWDDPLPESLYNKLISWMDSLSYLGSLRIPRMYNNISFGNANHRDVFVFADASKNAVAATGVSYIKLYDGSKSTTSFLMGKAKLVLMHGHSIPRLELCAAVLVTEIAENIRDQLKIPRDSFLFFTDSQVVLGYISNETRRFYIYVANRVGKIRLFSQPSQWHFVRTEYNPEDDATRSIDTSQLEDSVWVHGPGESFDVPTNRMLKLGLK